MDGVFYRKINFMLLDSHGNTYCEADTCLSLQYVEIDLHQWFMGIANRL